MLLKVGRTIINLDNVMQITRNEKGAEPVIGINFVGRAAIETFTGQDAVNLWLYLESQTVNVYEAAPVPGTNDYYTED